MSKTPAVKPPNIPIVIETPKNQNAGRVEVPVVEAIAWFPLDGGFRALAFKLPLTSIPTEFKDLTPEGPKPRHHVADTLKVALVNGFINPVGGT